MSVEQIAIAVELRSAGISYAEIGRQLKFNHECVRRSVNQALRESAELDLRGKAVEHIVMNVARVQHVIKCHWGKAGDHKSAAIILAAVKQETELLSLVIHAGGVVKPALAEGETVIDQRPVINVYEASPPAHLALKGQG